MPQKFRYIYLGSIGLMWAAFVAILPTLTSMIGIQAVGSSEFTRRATGALGDFLNIGIASLLLAFVLVVALRQVKAWELSIAILPAFIMNAVYFSPMIELTGNAYITGAIFLILLVVLPFVSTRAVAKFLANWG